MKRLDLSNNILRGRIPSEIGQLRAASILLEGNLFRYSSETAPLSLCVLREVELFDLVNDSTLCPIERNALSDFYDSTRGEEWTNDTLWLDEYTSYCDWKGVTCSCEYRSQRYNITCDSSKKVISLQLRDNGLSGRLSESIGNLTSIEVLDLSDNDIKVVLCTV